MCAYIGQISVPPQKLPSSPPPPQERTRLQETASRIQGEAIKLRDEKEAMQVALQLAQREAAEARGLWETELRSRASVSLRVSLPFHCWLLGRCVFTCMHYTMQHT